MNIEDRLADKLASEEKEVIIARYITEAELKDYAAKARNESAGQFGGGGQLAPEPEDAPKACSGPLMPQATDDKQISDMAEKLTQEEVKKMANCPGEERGDMKQMEATDDQDLQDIYQEKLVDDKAEVSRGMLSKTVDAKRPKYKDIKEGDVIELVNNSIYTVTDWYNGHVSAKGPDGKDYALYKSTYDFALKNFTRDNKVLWSRDMKQVEATDDQDLQDIYQEKLVDDKAEVSRGMLAAQGELIITAAKLIKFAKTTGQDGQNSRLVKVAGEMSEIARALESNMNRKAADELEVELSAVQNPDFRQKQSLPPSKKVKVHSVEEAAKVCRKYIEENHVGGGSWSGGQVRKDGQPHAYISFNGRAWMPGPVKNGKFQMSETPFSEKREASQSVVASESFYDAYVTAALWASTDNDDDPMDSNYDARDLAPETVRKMKADCEKFQKENKEDLELAEKQGHDEVHCGHDFWLTRNGHGAGFWDRDYITPDQKREYNQLSADKHDIEEQIEELKKEDMLTPEERRKEAELSRDLHDIVEEMAEIDSYKELGERLTKACKKFKEQNLYVGDDGKLYVE